MMMKIALCKSCGSPYDADEVNDGYCLLCMPESSSLNDIINLDLRDRIDEELKEQNVGNT